MPREAAMKNSWFVGVNSRKKDMVVHQSNTDFDYIIVNTSGMSICMSFFYFALKKSVFFCDFQPL